MPNPDRGTAEREPLLGRRIQLIRKEHPDYIVERDAYGQWWRVIVSKDDGVASTPRMLPDLHDSAAKAWEAVERMEREAKEASDDGQR